MLRMEGIIISLVGYMFSASYLGRDGGREGEWVGRNEGGRDGRRKGGRERHVPAFGVRREVAGREGNLL